MERHPLAEKLHALHQRRDASVAELKVTLHEAQLAVEEAWDRGDWDHGGPGFKGGSPRCGAPGCNYRRYPLSRFCMYHVTSNDTFAARLRRAEAKERLERR